MNSVRQGLDDLIREGSIRVGECPRPSGNPVRGGQRTRQSGMTSDGMPRRGGTFGFGTAGGRKMICRESLPDAMNGGDCPHEVHYGRINSGADPVFEEDDIFRIVVPLNDEYSADREVDKALSSNTTTGLAA